MLEKITEIFMSYRFEVADTSYSVQLKDEKLAVLKEITVTHPAFRLITHHPDLFVLHRTLPPEKAAFYVVLSKTEQLDDATTEMFLKHFPKEVLIVFENEKDIKCRWVRDKKSNSLTTFLDSYIK